MQPDRGSRAAWALAGLVSGAAGLATSYAAGLALTIRQSPVVAVAEWIIELTPGPVVHLAIELLGHLDKVVLTTGIVVFVLAACTVAGMLARRRPWATALVLAGLTILGVAAVASRPGFTPLDLAPLLVGLATWGGVLAWLAAGLAGPGPLSRQAPGTTRGESRRTFLVRTGVVAAVAVGAGVLGRVVGSGRRTAERTRRLLRLDGVTEPALPSGASIDLEGITPWRTPDREFYLIHTAIAVPTIDPQEWRLRVHGMVDRPLTLTFRDLVARELTEAWVTLSCVSNPIGGDLVGNAWWSGVRVRDVLAEAGVREGADAILQTSDDGWTCGTPLEAVTDDRDALLAVGMNGQALPIEHGFPVRMVVPGLYGFVSATKWLVDIEVTRFADFDAYWTRNGWSEEAPVRTASRIDVPRSGSSVPAGTLRAGGVAWRPHTGIRAVAVSLDGGPWREATLGRVPSVDTWVQWTAELSVGPGDHELRVRAQDGTGAWQTGEVRDVVPDGATGWHTVPFAAED